MRYLALCLGILLSGCVYKIDIPQGMSIKQSRIDQVQIGQTQAQVASILGTPVLTDPLRPNTWDYVHTLNGETKDAVRVVFDDQGRVSVITRF